MTIPDPVEKIIADALDKAGIGYRRDDALGLDFALAGDIYIEVKAYYSPRVTEQMSRAQSVIAIQGIEAAKWFAAAITKT